MLYLTLGALVRGVFRALWWYILTECYNGITGIDSTNIYLVGGLAIVVMFFIESREDSKNG